MSASDSEVLPPRKRTRAHSNLGNEFNRSGARVEQSKKNDGRFKNGTEHPRHVDRAKLLEKLKQRSPFGEWVVVGEAIVDGQDGYRRILCRCNVSGQVRLVHVDNLLSGKSRGPAGVWKQISKNSVVLGERYDAIKQRCNNPKNQNYPNYGGRGIKLMFNSRRKFIEWMEQNLPHEDYRGVELDRIDNDGHYEPGNLRLVSKFENLLNKRTIHWVEYGGQKVARSHVWHLIKIDHPGFGYGQDWTTKLLAQGLTISEVLKKGMAHPPRTYGAPDAIIVAYYRGKQSDNG